MPKAFLVDLLTVFAIPSSRRRNRWSSPHALYEWGFEQLAYPLGSLGVPHWISK